MYFDVNEWMLGMAHQYTWWSIIGLLSSSCCALQLLLNAMQFGCAGFNTILGPVRPHLLGLTVILQAGSWYVAWSRPWQWVPTTVSTAIALLLSLLPEILSLYSYRKQGRTNNVRSSTKDVVYSFRMKSVGCSACMVTVASVLENTKGVKSFDSSIEASRLCVVCTHEITVDEILSSLEDAGFPMDRI